MHCYNATAPVMRKVVFGLDEDGIVELATYAGAPVQGAGRASSPRPTGSFQYSPEMFSGTELDFAKRGLSTP